MKDNQIVQWQCDKCCGVVVGTEGYLAVDIPGVNRGWLAQQEWKGQQPSATVKELQGSYLREDR